MSWIRQALPLVLVALVVFQTLRTCWLERYVVSSESMEPTLRGDPVSGDRVLVDKSAAWWWTPERGDLVVVRNPDNARSHFVKRVVGLGGERVRLMRGDGFIWESGLGDWRRWEKDPLEFRDMRMPYFEYPGGGEEPVQGFLYGLGAAGPEGRDSGPPAGEDLESLRLLLGGDARTRRLGGRPGNDHLPGHFGTTRAVDTRFLDSRGELRGIALPCQDIGMKIEVAPVGDVAGLQLVFVHEGEYYNWSYRADGQVQFYGAGEPIGEPIAAAPLVADGFLRIEFGYLDGHFFLIEGDRVAGRWDVELPLFGQASTPPGLGFEPHNLLHVGVAGGSVTLARLAVFHDVYYQALPRPFREAADIPVGELWLLGDNTFDSNDSRSKGSFLRSDVVGRPVMILGPVGRFAVLPR